MKLGNAEGRIVGFDEELTEGSSVLKVLGTDDGSKVKDVTGDLLGLFVEGKTEGIKVGFIES